jgi:TolB-like protein/DNA-binding winged helix-turn-helix (wHTH) protein/Flp pilus assembly protein TadD
MESKPLYEFGHFLLDPSQRILLREGERVHLHPKTFLILQTLVEANGDVVSKDDLMAKVWPDVVVEENNLTKNMSLLRKAMGNGSESAEFIETIPKVGYRFRAEVLTLHAQNGFRKDALATGQMSAEQVESAAENKTTNAGRRHNAGKPAGRHWLWVGLAIALAIGRMLVWVRWPWSQHTSKPVPATTSLAVLPFKNLTGDVSQDFFTDGLAEDLTNDLSRIRALNVISRNSAFTFKGQDVDVREAGRKLNVAAVLEGAVARTGEQWQITATLRETQTGRVLWRGEHHNRPLEDIFAIQEEVRCNVAANLQVVLCGEAVSRKQTGNLEAYLAYLKGLYQLSLRTSESLRQAIGYFERAVALDPNYAEAWAFLADAYYLGRWYIPLSNEVMPKMGAAARRAVELDDSSAHAHFALAVYFSSQEQQAESDRETERVRALNPNLPRFVHSQGITKALLGQYEKGIEMMRQAQRLDPLSLVVNSDVGYVYYIARRYDEAVAAYRYALTMDPKFSLAHLLLGLALSQQGKHAEAIAEVRQAADRGSEQLAALGNVYARAGQRREALEALAQLQQLARQKYVPPYQFAWVYCGLGDLDRAVESLQESARQKAGVIDFKHHPIYEPLRNDPRYQKLLSRAAYPW